MRDILFDDIVQAVRDLCIEANCALPCDLKAAISAAQASEPSPVGRSILGDLVENYTFAGEKRLPICQDTGMAVVFCDLGQEAHITGGLLSDAVNRGVALGYTEGFLRKSVVRDPIRRVNTEDNTPAVLHLRLVEGDGLTSIPEKSRLPTAFLLLPGKCFCQHRHRYLTFPYFYYIVSDRPPSVKANFLRNSHTALRTSKPSLWRHYP